MNPLAYFLLMLKASLFSFSGTGNLPILHADLVSRGWATDRHFMEALAVGQVSPGPSGLWVISLGYLLDGLRGSTLALVAICVPPLLVLLIARAYRRVRDHPAMEGFMRGLSLAVVGIFVVVLLSILASAGVSAASLLIMAAAAALGFTRRVPVVLILLLAALTGWLLH